MQRINRLNSTFKLSNCPTAKYFKHVKTMALADDLDVDHALIQHSKARLELLGR